MYVKSAICQEFAGGHSNPGFLWRAYHNEYHRMVIALIPKEYVAFISYSPNIDMGV
jgi:hypothetical protein